MSNIDYSFEKEPWEQELDLLHPGDHISAAALLTLLEQEDELTVEEALTRLEDTGVTLDISHLPPVALTGSTALRLKQEASHTKAEAVLRGLDENDPLRLYLQELAATPAAGDPQLLSQRYSAGEHHLAQQLVTLCLSQVVELAMEYTGHGVLLLDLIQEGSLGLWQSILCYEDGDFQTHCRWWIRQYMAKAVFLQARSGGIGQKLRQDMEDYRDADQRLLVELGRNPTPEEIAQMLHISPEECALLEKMVENARMMDKAHQSQQEPEPTPEDEQAVEDTAYFQVRQRIAELLSGLEAEDSKLISLRYGLADGKAMSPVEVGALLNITPEQVVVREAEILARLRDH